MPECICYCSKRFRVAPSVIAKGHGKYCSNACYWQAMKVTRKGDGAPNWKGNEVGYAALHDWVRREKGAPARCEECGTTDGRLEWANISQDYRREVDDWKALCKRCHFRHDSKTCRRGHERTAENTWLDGKGYPHCRPCRNERLRMQRAGRRAEWDRGTAGAGAIRRKYGASAGVRVGREVRD